MAKERPISTLKLLTLIRDSHQFSGSQRALLDALALRANPDRDYRCWPSYATLALDTGLDETTLRRAAKALEDANLIRRQRRKTRSNIFFVNVALIQKRALEEAEARSAALEAGGNSPFDPPAFDGRSDEGTDSEGGSWDGGAA